MAATAPPPAIGDPTAGARRISIWRYLAIVAGYLAILLVANVVGYVIAGGGGSTTSGGAAGSPGYTETAAIWSRMVLPVGVSLAFVLAVVTRLGWWRAVVHDHRPVQRWVWVVPGLLALTIVAGTNYGGLAEKSLGFVVTLLLGTMLIGLTEEIMFRGLGVTAFRVNGYGERAVALWTSALFGLSHAVALVGGPTGVIQVVHTLVGGILYYLTRRVSGGLLVPVLLHGLWDFGVYSAAVVEGETYSLVPLFFLPHLVLGMVLLVRRRRIEPKRPLAIA